MMNSVDDYIAKFPKPVQTRLKAIRKIVRKEAPEAEEAMVYGVPTFTLNGNLVHYAAFKHHVGFYPTPSGVKKFKEELKPYKTAPGTIQFPLDQPLPLDLITKIVKFRVKEQR